MVNKAIEVPCDCLLSGDSLQALRLWKPLRGELITVIDQTFSFFRARVVEISPQTALIRVFERKASEENKLSFTLHQALPEKERMEWIIQKATELGVQTIVPFQSEKSITLIEREQKQKKAHHWPLVALRAAKQCRRSDLPTITPVCSFEESLDLAQYSQSRLFLWEKAPITSTLTTYLQHHHQQEKRFSIMIGPEGGFSSREATLAQRAGFTPISLGPRLLRTETAPLVILSILQFLLGDLG